MKNSHSPEKADRPASGPSFEKKIIASILSKIREGRRTPSPNDAASGFRTAEGLPAAKIREAGLADCDAVTELKRRWGLVPDPCENWQKLWVCNPVLKHVNPERPIGWILEAGGKAVGYLGNISLLYHYGDRMLTAVTGSGLVVEPTYRSASLSLNSAFYSQKFVDLFLTTTAIEAVGKIARAFKCDPIPQPDYETVLFWVLKPFRFAQAMMGKLALNPILSRAGSVPVSLAVGADKILHRRWPKRHSNRLSVREISVNEISDDFQTLWQDKLNEGPRLLADRSPSTLRWHFGIPEDRGITKVLCCYEKQELAGYAVIRSESNRSSGLQRSLVADILVKRDDAEIVRALGAAAFDHAKRAGSHTLELLGFPQSIRQVFLQWNPYLRKYPACPFFYKAVDPALHKTLSDGTAWYASPFDGDTTLMP